MREARYFQTRNGLQLEYSVAGTGRPILMMHGGHSNCQEEFGYQELMDQGYAIITPSRPGYGKTDRLIGNSLKSACRAYAELLDHLEVERVHLVAMSAGGPSAITFAALYPGRVSSLTLQSAVTKEWLTPQDKEYKAARILFHPAREKYSWKLVSLCTNLSPKFLFRQMLPSFSTLKLKEVQPYIQEGDLEAFRKMNSRQRSGSGFFIDLQQTAQLDPAHSRQIRCPVLIIHSKHDQAVRLDHALHASGAIPDALMLIVDTWGHLIWFGKGSELVHQETAAFLREADILVGIT
ncbi:alpha/beta fold hydrolase [Planococcus lenghuensis]|uniref:Alpha/beta hydrolase n=1 Tax=Planococcus lenghuensis TaxID=2213202 RepID=A0A1Q2L220_9BACL|nr:alpha/beta hydrolase [Planococcus lenghuensis]AQQ54515.1 alpha/beta hydrolase [Planococcus lenghuensis]